MKDLPHDLDSERDFLGCAFRDFRMVAQYAALEPSDFFSEKHRIIWQALQNLHRDGKASLEEDYSILPYFVVAEAKKLGGFGGFFPDGGEYIFEVFENAPGLSNADCFAEKISNASALRKTISLLQKNIAEACEPGADANAVIASLMERVGGIAGKHAGCGEKHLADVASEVLGRLRERAKGGLPSGAQTGFRDLDSLIGGLRPGELVVVGACTGMGKTSFALNIALHVAKAMPVLFFSLEMDENEFCPRGFSFFGGVNLGRLINARFSEEEYGAQDQAMEKLRKLGIYVEFEAALKIGEICAAVHAFTAKHGKGLVVIDHLHFLRTDGGKHENRNIALGEITHALKALAKKLRIPILLLSQLSRESVKTAGKSKVPPPRLHDLRDSGNIEQDANMVLFIHRPGKYDDNEDASLAYIKVAKNRNGPTGTVRLCFDGSAARFHDAPAIGRDGYEIC